MTRQILVKRSTKSAEYRKKDITCEAACKLLFQRLTLPMAALFSQSKGWCPTNMCACRFFKFFCSLLSTRHVALPYIIQKFLVDPVLLYGKEKATESCNRGRESHLN